MKMMEHVGTVVAVEGDRATVELRGGDGCEAGPLFRPPWRLRLLRP